MKEFNDIEDLEQLLKPQCEFHASDKLKDEVIAKAKAEVRPRKVRLLPWLAAACVAGIIGLFLMPPEQADEGLMSKVESRKNKVESRKCKVESIKGKVESVSNEEAKPEPSVAVIDRKQQVRHSVRNVKAEEPKVQEPKQIQPKEQAMPIEQYDEEMILSECDVPITRPENLIDTPEDLALIARLEKQAFINRMREQVEIAKAELINETLTEEN